MKRWSTKHLVSLAMLAAIQVVLSRFCSISAWNIKLGFGFAPVAAAAILYGPLAAGAMAVASDLIGAILFPVGAFFPGYTLNAFLTAFVFGLFLRKKQSLVRIVCAAAINQFLLGLFLQTLWISIQSGSPYWPLVGTRLVQAMVMFPVQVATIQALARLLARFPGKAQVSSGG